MVDEESSATDHIIRPMAMQTSINKDNNLYIQYEYKNKKKMTIE